jgi:hypothetical protein
LFFSGSISEGALVLCFLLLWERGASASNRRYKEHYSLWLLRSGDRLFPLQKTLLVTSSPKDLFRQSCSGFTDLSSSSSRRVFICRLSNGSKSGWRFGDVAAAASVESPPTSLFPLDASPSSPS